MLHTYSALLSGDQNFNGH